MLVLSRSRRPNGCLCFSPIAATNFGATHKVVFRKTTFLLVAKVGRGTPEGFSDPHEFQIAASNLTATKARLLLMACLLKFGSLPAAADPDNPSAAERSAIRAAIEPYQEVFDTH